MSDNQFVVTARKWRPLKFNEVVGQAHITSTLLNAIKSERIHHAYLFSGPRGVGKTTTARIFARAMNCLSPVDSEPCNECDNCKAMLNGRSMDIIEIDGASNNSVDDIRKLRENAKYPPSSGKYKMYIIDEVHMLSTSAFNALLKTLEEPPAHLLFVFATTEAHKVPPTILSRCQRFDFKRMKIDDISAQLQRIADAENITLDEQSLITIAKKADGSMRDGQSIFDQVVAFCGSDIDYSKLSDALHLIDEEFFFRITQAICDKDANEMLKLASEVFSKGYALQQCLQGLLEHMRNIMTIIITGDDSLIESSSEFVQRYIESAKKFTKSDMIMYMDLVSKAEQSIKFSAQPKIKFEFTLIQLSTMDKAIELDRLIEEIHQLKESGQTIDLSEKKNPIINKPTQTNRNKQDNKQNNTDIPKKSKQENKFIKEKSSDLKRIDISNGEETSEVAQTLKSLYNAVEYKK